MDLLSLGIFLGFIALIIVCYLAAKANNVSDEETEEIPEPINTVAKKWYTEETIVAYYLSTYGDDVLGPFLRIAKRMERTPSSLRIKIKIFDDLSNENITKNATKLDRYIFDEYRYLSRSGFYSAVIAAVASL